MPPARRIQVLFVSASGGVWIDEIEVLELHRSHIINAKRWWRSTPATTDKWPIYFQLEEEDGA